MDHFEELPKPEWILEPNEVQHEEFPVWDKKDALTFIIGQKYHMFPALLQLERIDENEPPDLFTIEARISVLPDYGPKEIIEDLNYLEEYVTEMAERKLFDRRDYYQMRRKAALLLKMVKEELEGFETCSDCVAFYYNSNDYFTIPCQKLHSVVFVRCPKGIWWPGKTLRIKDNRVEVAFFRTHTKSWLPFDRCIMASTCFRHDIRNEMQNDAILEMGKYVQMIARKHRRYWKGFTCNGKEQVVFKPEFLTISDEQLVSESPGNKCLDCDNEIRTSVKLPRPKRSHDGSLNSQLTKKPKTTLLPSKPVHICDRSECQKRAIQECFFCDKASFCSNICSHKAFAEHEQVCTMSKCHRKNLVP